MKRNNETPNGVWIFIYLMCHATIFLTIIVSEIKISQQSVILYSKSLQLLEVLIAN